MRAWPSPPAPRKSPGAITTPSAEQALGEGLGVAVARHAAPEEEAARPADGLEAGDAQRRLQHRPLGPVALPRLVDVALVAPRGDRRALQERRRRDPDVRAASASSPRSAAGRRRRSRCDSRASTSAWTASGRRARPSGRRSAGQRREDRRRARSRCRPRRRRARRRCDGSARRARAGTPGARRRRRVARRVDPQHGEPPPGRLVDRLDAGSQPAAGSSGTSTTPAPANSAPRSGTG